MKNKNIFELFILNRETLQYEKLNYKTYIYSIFIILFIGSGVGFKKGIDVNYKSIPMTTLVHKDSANLFLHELDYEQIIEIESKSKDNAISCEGAIGSMQIMPIALEEYNKHHVIKYTQEDLYIRKINLKIGKWLISERIPYYLNHYKIPNTLTYKLMIYNMGIGNFLIWYNSGRDWNKLNTETKNYILKYWQKY
jgi:hypothetical protein